ARQEELPLEGAAEGLEVGAHPAIVLCMIAFMKQTILVALLCVGGLAEAKPGDWVRIGKEGDWRGTKHAAADGGRLYSVETDGAFYVTDLASGAWQKAGKAEFGDTRQLWAGDGVIVSLEKDGTLYRIQPNGSWAPIGKAGEWKQTTHGAILGGK